MQIFVLLFKIAPTPLYLVREHLTNKCCPSTVNIALYMYTVHVHCKSVFCIIYIKSVHSLYTLYRIQIYTVQGTYRLYTVKFVQCTYIVQILVFTMYTYLVGVHLTNKCGPSTA